MSKFSDVVNGLALDQAQAAALTGSVLVRAGGTGNTNTLTAGVARRIAKRGSPAQRILAVTSTSKAAVEMRGRIQAALGEAAAPSWLGALHGLDGRRLRAEAEAAGLRPGFDLAYADDRSRMVKRR
jgi:DNA helicase-2/ATP-dependent DNA helicase PcrA